MKEECNHQRVLRSDDDQDDGRNEEEWNGQWKMKEWMDGWMDGRKDSRRNNGRMEEMDKERIKWTLDVEEGQEHGISERTSPTSKLFISL